MTNATPEPCAFDDGEMQTLKASALFVGHSPVEVAARLREFDVRRKTYRSGAVVADESGGIAQMGVVLSGFLHVYDSAFKGRRHLVRIVRPGGIVGATLVATRRTFYPALVTAYGDCAVAVFSLAAMRMSMKRRGDRFFDNVSVVVGEELMASWRKIAILSCPNIAERVMLHLKDLCRQEKSTTVAIGSTEAAFADYLGVSRTALARTLRILAKEGRLSYKKDVFTLPV